MAYNELLITFLILLI